MAIENADGTIPNTDYAISKHDKTFVYKVGDTVSVQDFDNNRFIECTKGIHFFVNRQ